MNTGAHVDNLIDVHTDRLDKDEVAVASLLDSRPPTNSFNSLVKYKIALCKMNGVKVRSDSKQAGVKDFVLYKLTWRLWAMDYIIFIFIMLALKR